MPKRGTTFHRLIVTTSLLLPLPACTGSSGSSSASGGLPIEAALGLSALENDLPRTGTTADCIQAGTPATETHRAMLEALNLYRLQNGLNPLTYSERLEDAANAHVRDLWARSFFDHVNPDSLGPSERALEAGFCHQYVGENIAAGQRSVQAVTEAWKNSPPHDDNMLEPGFAYVGMGYFVDPTGRQYWGQLLAFEYP